MKTNEAKKQERQYIVRDIYDWPMAFTGRTAIQVDADKADVFASVEEAKAAAAKAGLRDGQYSVDAL